MPLLVNQLNKAQESIYGRKRIIDCLYTLDPDKFKSLLTTDINSISLEGSQVICNVDNTLLSLGRRDVLNNFLTHRTRTPSFFNYTVWKKYKSKDPNNGIPIAALDYSSDQTHHTISINIGRPPKILTDSNGEQKIYFVKVKEQECSCPSWVHPIAALDYSSDQTHHTISINIGRPPKILTDSNGEQKIYFVKVKEQECSCPSWVQLNANKVEMVKEVYEVCKDEYVPICKHISWNNANLELETLRYIVQEQSRKKGYNLNMCIYHFDYRSGRLLYRVTNDGIKDKMNWLPKNSWKEQQIYTADHNPTGNCWKVFTKALTHVPPYQLIKYSQSVAYIMGQIKS